jgi:hypothetical protein
MDTCTDNKELAQLRELINQALSLADKNNLLIVGVKLDEARHALDTLREKSEDCRGDQCGFGNVSPLSRTSSEGNIVTLHPPVSFERLLAEHESLDQMRRGLMELVEGPPSPFEAERQLDEFEEAIASHRADELRWVYGPLLARRIGDDPQVGSSYRELVLETEDAWARYFHKWKEQRIAASWATFGLETHQVLTRAGERMRLEERIIYPLALRKGMIRLRDAG